MNEAASLLSECPFMAWTGIALLCVLVACYLIATVIQSFSHASNVIFRHSAK